MTKQNGQEHKIRSGAAAQHAAGMLGFGEPRRSQAKAGQQRVGWGTARINK